MNLKTFLRTGALLILIGLVAACGQAGEEGTTASSEENAAGDVKTIKVANYFASDHPQNVALRETFKPMVEENSEGRLKVEIYDNSQLGGEEAFLEGVRNGTIEMVIAGMFLQNSEPKIGVVEWPFIIRDYDHAKKVLNGPIGEEIAQAFEQFGVKPLNWTANGFRVVSSNRAIESLEDFNGFRLRMPNIPNFISVGEALGASVIPLAISEVFTALEQGVIDGQENPYATLVHSRFYEVQSHVIETRHIFSPNIYLVNQAFWDGLGEDLQQVVAEAADAAAEEQWQLLIAQESEMKQYLQEQGLEIIEPDDAFRQEMVDAMQPVYEELFEKYEWAEDLYNRITQQ
ncbi:hypothetical protein GCM10010965_13960 [Caldalkalibacillus thermarum]|uniref:TRAP transporter substrate-binding protein n=1 Tax=Caldalkalibacillus thermarum TaxID=296745 RepID=UPI00166A1265|nr:TRAP transporter substrate-binding protein [Caldalkalibacillus thermarum]GGK22220.1 hypothetical protein GCM10010965_13960 [Caldalkalibacillus thermarum]